MAQEKTSLTTGARNPYSVAELLLKKRINWGKKGHKGRKIVLEKAFGMPYHELFDPKCGSPLFVPPEPTTGILDLHTGDLTPCDPFPCPAPTYWNRYKDASGNYGQYTVNGRIYRDAVQACLPDCFFIAALSSYAFAPPPNAWILKNQTVSPYKFQFYSPPAAIGGQVIKDTVTPVTDNLPLDAAYQLIHARSMPDDKEIWPNLWEKAYATWNWWVSAGKPLGQYNDSPAYSNICQGNPYLALLNLTGLKFEKTTWLTTDAVFTSDPAITAAQAIYKKISTSLCGGLPAAIRPAVAMTYDPRTDTVPAGVTYSNSTIVGNHSYSLLGLYTQADTKNQYIVLRNPWGQKAGAGDPVLAGDTLAAGTWQDVPALEYRDDGIFGLKIDTFQTHFKGFGWVA